ncbi:MAG TPA: 5-formyltetrahydrofolate cyclo-ligase [Candidatus Brachybacterium merdavium]|uniref:5-formyltetrahydrofolate cyclo-ligase n=1 Tax=Candidatus Brachybacterium merdavium TaxID=2838513 RepID=A0A9D2RQG0_9MICO|nr:5-formyltetrahydrofolate cyclo-ligase [Candidatus Brachybacterium merdavium]
MDSEALRAHKKTLRTELRARRAQRYGGEQGARRRELEAVRLLEHGRPLLGEIFGRAAADGSGDGPVVAAYHPTGTEADPRMLVRELVDRGARMIFPAAAGPELDWILWDGRSEFIESPGRGFGREPRGSRLGAAAIAQAALVLAPAVAIDRSGTRIGHGAGYYDRALTLLPPAAKVVGVIHPEELLAAGALPRGPLDVPVSRVLTADGLVTLEVS